MTRDQLVTEILNARANAVDRQIAEWIEGRTQPEVRRLFRNQFLGIERVQPSDKFYTPASAARSGRPALIFPLLSTHDLHKHLDLVEDAVAIDLQTGEVWSRRNGGPGVLLSTNHRRCVQRIPGA